MKKITPTVEEIISLHTRCSTIYGGLQNQFKEDEQYYELDFRELLNLPEEFKGEGVVLPTARDMVDACVDHTDVTNARVFVNRKGTSLISADEVEMMRKFYLGLIHRTTVESSISPWRTSSKHYWLYGLAVMKTVWDADRWVDKPEQKTDESENDYAGRIDEWRSESTQSIPIVIQAVNPFTIMPDPYEGGGRFVFETRTELVFDVASKYPRWGNPEGKTADKEVTHISFWTPHYRCELYDGEPVLKVKGGVAEHAYGFIPYILIDTGLGNVAHDNDPKKRYVGVLRYIRDLCVSESRNYSINDVVLKRNAYPWFTIEGDNAEAVTVINQRYGVGNKLPRGTKIVQQTPQIPSQAIQQHLAITSDYIAAHAAPNVIHGLGESGVRSGADRRQIIAEAATRYQYSSEAFRNGTAKVLTNCAKLMKNVIPGDIRVWAKTPMDEFDIEIKKDKMKEPFTCYVEFAPVSEEDEYRRHDDLERLAQTGIVTRKWARTQMSNVDPIAMELDEEIEKLKVDPAFQQIITQYATGKLMEALTKRSQAESLENPPPAMPQEMTQGVPQGGIVPSQNITQQGVPRQMISPIPQVAPLGSAEDLRNKLEQMRSKTPVNPIQGMGGGGNR